MADFGDLDDIDIVDFCIARVDAYKAKGFKVNTNYFGVYKHYLRWYARKDDIVSFPLQRVDEATNGPSYITQYNVEQYYEDAVVNMKGNYDTVTKKISALNFFKIHIEHRKSEKVINSPSITDSIITQQNNNNAGTNETYAGSDPHKGLKDILSEEENVKLVRTIYSLRNDSHDLAFSYTWGRNAGVRGASSRALKFSDLNISTGFGPEIDAPRNRTLLMILRRGDVHKDNHGTDKQVGIQRHRDYRQCAAFATGMLLVTRLRELEGRLNFLHPDRNSRADWWDVPINKYENYHQEANAMRAVLDMADIETAKTTHHRTQCVQIAGSRGLHPWQVSCLTKHIMDKYNSAYQPEAEEMTMKVMSGFRKHETRFVRHEHVEFPPNYRGTEYLDQGIRLLIPHYDRYVDEHNSTYGDKGPACRKFLFEVIPYLVETLLQDGYYFVREFPNHDFAHLLKVSTTLLQVPVYNNLYIYIFIYIY